MFRRPGKNSLEEEEHYKYADTPKKEHYKYQEPPQNEVPPRIFEHPRQSVATPLSRAEENWEDEKNTLPHHFEQAMNEEAPETTLGEGVTFRGELSFERLLRIDGTFEGELLSQGKVVVGPKGVVKANLTLREAVIEGVVEGNITVQEKLELRGEAAVTGDIKAQTISIDEGVRLEGHISVAASV